MQKREALLRESKSRTSPIERNVQRYIFRYAEQREKSRWRIVLGYLATLPLVVLTLLLTFVLRGAVQELFLRSGVLVLAIALTALFWGWGPSLILTFLGAIALDYFVITPSREWSLVKWPEVLQLVPYCLAGISIGLLSRLRDKGWVAARDQARQLAEANRKLENEAQLRDRFLSMTSHELKTPITSIRVQSQLLQRQLHRRGSAENSSTLQGLSKIDERTDALTAMIDELLDFSRTQNTLGTWKRELLDMKDLCREVIEDQRLVTGRTIHWYPPAAPASVWGDAQRLTQVVNNLVSNASKYSPMPEPIEVVVENEKDQIVLVQVRDHGQGIDQDQIAHIFEPFYRAPDTQFSATGLGLGLAIAKQIVDFHQGQMWCVSEKGLGSTFFVSLPFTSHAPL